MHKLLLVTSEIRSKSGYGRVSLELIESFKKKGIEVLVVCQKENKELKDIKQIPVLYSPMSFKKNFFFFGIPLLKLFKYRKEIKECDSIQCIVEIYSFFTFFLAKFLQKRYFLLMHGTYTVAFFRYKFFAFLQKFAYRRAKKIICVSNFTKNKILEHVNLQNLVVIPNGVNLENFKKEWDVEQIKKENVLMSLGAFKERKGFKYLIRALAIVVKEVPSLECFVGGGAGVDKSYYNEVFDLADELKISDKIKFFENISDEYINNLYKKAKVFALTPVSREYNFEGFGLIYLEANAHSIPVVGMSGSGVEDAIKDGYNGFLAKERDIKDIAEKIIILFKNEEMYQKMSQNSLNWAREHSWDNIINKYENIIFS